ncbi:PIN-like domain-containing protein [Streptacidiphilus sp. N1-10]|uniref:PIN-like domain-containing protein n=1 Tax=Streptacidiphilus jeojiensis TaxID=3229225 RepID=A0ABV6XXY5_9ACTN
MQNREDLPFSQRYGAWLQPDSDSQRELFFGTGIIVLDANILLSLYEYTPAARDDVFKALEQIKRRLWLPHQVGLEFVRNRHSVLSNRLRSLNEAPKSVNQRLGEAERAIIAARRLVQDLLIRYGRNSTAAETLAEMISDSAIKELFRPWRDQLRDHIAELKEHDLRMDALGLGDTVVQRVGELFEERIALQPSPQEIRRRVEEAASYRYPNNIPPGFSDSGKDTALRSAGDYLIWEEIIEHAAEQEAPQRILFVSSDVKEDWYEPPEPGRASRPWPTLAEELWQRAGARLRIETPQEFFQGIESYFGAEITDSTFSEINAVAETSNTEQLVADVREQGVTRLADFLRATNRPLGDVYRTGASWNALVRHAGLTSDVSTEEEQQLFRRVPSFLHVDDAARISGYLQLLEDDTPSYSELDSSGQAYAHMLIFNLWTQPAFTTFQAGIDRLHALRHLREELRDVLNMARVRHPQGAQLQLPEGPSLPLYIHAAYNREEILTAIGKSGLSGPFPANFREGVAWGPEINADTLLVTMRRDRFREKDGIEPDGDQHYDGALTRSLFQWESQNSTDADSPVGQRYQSPSSRTLVFVRPRPRSPIGHPEPWVLAGQADYISHEGSRPMRVLWQLDHPLPTDVWSYARKR